MSKAKAHFEEAIKDAEELLAHFDGMNTHPPPPNAEVLKRAGLIMAFTAWETYVEDRVLEGVQARLSGNGSAPFSEFVVRRLREDVNRLHNPNSAKTRHLFKGFLDIDVTEHWKWSGYQPSSARKKLDELLKKRGDAVHRSSRSVGGPPRPHLIRRDELKKTINFLKSLVEATDNALSDEKGIAKGKGAIATESPQTVPSG